MTALDLAGIAAGITMGLWLDRLVVAAGSRVLLLLGLAALGACLLAGQDWAGTAIGCLLGAQVIAALPSRE
ncbi:hypothetical protein [Paracraurococcus lichenis]|uniref:Glycine transporter domain-containing protein n=1 Tax=Paracraurococcus lichenis TaxID=3064888 RepID=A0ABT9E8N0_9PROT|nr:hypothetical protein [Paracraurococcus sp. LOR1-02]MDO9712430.1 hypothetical protein [Paracraurococcus sp. LOR1-02]